MREIVDRGQRLAAGVQGHLSWLPPTAARLVVGWIFVQTGWGKLHDLEHVVQFFRELGIPAPELQAPFVAATELGCGLLVLSGLATRLAALPLIAVMTVALSTALRDRISELSDLFGLAEFLYALLLAGLVVLGAGPLSLDALVSRSLTRST